MRVLLVGFGLWRAFGFFYARNLFVKKKKKKLLENSPINLIYITTVNKPERPIKGRKKLSCREERQIREDKGAKQKAKPHQVLFYVRIKLVC